MTYVEQLERETEQKRTQLANTLDELRTCMTSGNLVHQIADRLGDGAAVAFTRNMRDQAVNNRLPIAIMGASLAWLIVGSRTTTSTGPMRRTAGRMRDAADDAAESVRAGADGVGSATGKTGPEWSDEDSSARNNVVDSISSSGERAKKATSEARQRMRDAAGSMAESARETAAQSAESVRETAASMAESVQRNASDGYETITESARRTASLISESTKAAGHHTLQKSNTFLDFCREQPLLLTGIGIAVGALMGALLPATEMEDRIAGETTDRMKEGAQDLASEQYDKTTTIGERALDAAEDELPKQAQKAGAGGGSIHEGKSDHAPPAPDKTLTSEGEWRGQPWNAKDAPI